MLRLFSHEVHSQVTGSASFISEALQYNLICTRAWLPKADNNLVRQVVKTRAWRLISVRHSVSSHHEPSRQDTYRSLSLFTDGKHHLPLRPDIVGQFAQNPRAEEVLAVALK